MLRLICKGPNHRYLYGAQYIKVGYNASCTIYKYKQNLILWDPRIIASERLMASELVKKSSDCD